MSFVFGPLPSFSCLLLSLRMHAAKCVSRKCRCTFVKFHRQTAPAGPGHSARAPAAAGAAPSSAAGGPLLSSSAALAAGMPMLANTASTSSGLSAGALGLPPRGYDDDFLLGPPPPSAASSSSTGGAGSALGGGQGQPQLQTMAETLYHSNSFAFPALYPSSSSASAVGGAGELDYAAKYRAQAELFGSTAPGRVGGSGLTPGGIYDTRGAGSGWLAGWETQEEEGYGQQQQQQNQLQQLRQQQQQQQQLHQQLQRQQHQQLQQRQGQPSRGEAPVAASMHVNGNHFAVLSVRYT